jgi:hypothetical protein
MQSVLGGPNASSTNLSNRAQFHCMFERHGCPCGDFFSFLNGFHPAIRENCEFTSSWLHLLIFRKACLSPFSCSSFRIHSGSYHIKKWPLVSQSQSFLQGFYPSRQPLNEVMRCRSRISQERPDGIRKVISIFLQIPAQHGQVIPQFIRAKLECE